MQANLIYDWTPADVICAMHRRGLTLTSLSRSHNLHSRTLNAALWRPYRNGERIIASALGLSAAAIWPSRYRQEGDCG
ncbi:MAG: helix-turn-helix domain-containing protein [Candidatus Binataceae bacterium]